MERAMTEFDRLAVRLSLVRDSDITTCAATLLLCLLASLPPCFPAPCFYAPSAMRRNPRKLESEEELYAAGVGALARRAHSVFEMRTYLERRSDDKDTVKRVLARLRERKYLDDARYARQFAGDRSRLRHQGRYRIARELRTRGVPDAHIESALAELAGQTDEAAEVRRQIARRT